METYEFTHDIDFARGGDQEKLGILNAIAVDMLAKVSLYDLMEHDGEIRAIGGEGLRELLGGASWVAVDALLLHELFELDCDDACHLAVDLFVLLVGSMLLGGGRMALYAVAHGSSGLVGEEILNLLERYAKIKPFGSTDFGKIDRHDLACGQYDGRTA